MDKILGGKIVVDNFVFYPEEKKFCEKLHNFVFLSWSGKEKKILDKILGDKIVVKKGVANKMT